MAPLVHVRAGLSIRSGGRFKSHRHRQPSRRHRRRSETCEGAAIAVIVDLVTGGRSRPTHANQPALPWRLGRRCCRRADGLERRGNWEVEGRALRGRISPLECALLTDRSAVPHGDSRHLRVVFVGQAPEAPKIIHHGPTVPPLSTNHQ